jgi:hypothetical protein
VSEKDKNDQKSLKNTNIKAIIILDPNMIISEEFDVPTFFLNQNDYHELLKYDIDTEQENYFLTISCNFIFKFR